MNASAMRLEFYITVQELTSARILHYLIFSNGEVHENVWTVRSGIVLLSYNKIWSPHARTESHKASLKAKSLLLAIQEIEVYLTLSELSPSFAVVKAWVVEFKRGYRNNTDMHVLVDQNRQLRKIFVEKKIDRRIVFSQLRRNPKDFLCQLIIEDNTCIHHFFPATKSQVKQWTMKSESAVMGVNSLSQASVYLEKGRIVNEIPEKLKCIIAQKDLYHKILFQDKLCNIIEYTPF
ncbi:hypothetical protein ABEB36_008959 [Hypothenemus hampei]|uniref:Uncharacterized protein n=1 Tax=Hypothenemus hampei TaxID=57062 RepID=A0ABD1ERL2_HYPHA